MRPCTTYFVAELPRIVREYEEHIALIKPLEDVAAILATSASTLDRAFKGLPRIKPFAVRANRRSGLNRPILDAIKCKPRPISTRQRRLKSGQQLTNKKNKRQLQGARPT